MADQSADAKLLADALTGNMVLLYQSRQYEQAQTVADTLLQKLEGDMVALYFKGAAILRLSTPGSFRIDEAMDCWSAAMAGAHDDDDLRALEGSIRNEFSQIAYGAINQAATYWHTYENGHFADELVAIFESLDRCQAKCAAGDYDCRLARTFEETVGNNRHKWIALVVGVDMNIPLGLTPKRLQGYADVLSCATSQALRMLYETSAGTSQDSDALANKGAVSSEGEDATISAKEHQGDEQVMLVARRAIGAFKRFAAHHEELLSEEQKDLLARAMQISL